MDELTHNVSEWGGVSVPTSRRSQHPSCFHHENADFDREVETETPPHSETLCVNSSISGTTLFDTYKMLAGGAGAAGGG